MSARARTIGAASLLILVVPAATGCALFRSRPVARATHDLGPLPAVRPEPPPPVLMVDVRAGPAASGTDLRYRRADDPTRVFAYRESRWLAPPAELLERRLRDALDGSPGGTDAMRLEVVVQRFEQVFETELSARAEMRLRVLVYDGSVAEPLASRTFSDRRPTSTPDAEGAVAALASLADATIAEIALWLNSVAATRTAAEAPRR